GILARVGHGERLGAALALVVAGAWTDRVHVTPVGLGLRVLLWVAVDLARRSDEDARVDLARHVEHVERAVDRGADGPHRIALVVDRRRGAGEVIDLVDLDDDGLGDVVADELEATLAEEGLDALARAGEEVVEANDLIAVGEEAPAEM